MTTLLDWLREHRGLKGTKEGCAEGDCGACTVVLERADGRREAINSCIALLGQIDGQAVRTVEGLRGAGRRAASGAGGDGRGRCHAMRLLHAGLRHVGLCLRRRRRAADLETIHDALAGNLCRCTGYRPIVEAMTKVGGPAGRAGAAPPPARARLRRASAARFFAPRSLAELLALRAAHPEALLLAGATDLGLLASRVAQAAGRGDPCGARAGAARRSTARQGADHDRRRRDLRATPCRPLIAAYPALTTYLARLGSRQIRTLGTIGGNIGTASPIGDMPPVLLALEASAEAGLAARRARAAAGGFLPRLSQDGAGARRGDPEHLPCRACGRARSSSATRSASGATRTSPPSPAPIACGSRTARSRTCASAFGGMAATPKRARHVEAALLADGFAARADARRAALQGFPADRRLARHRRLSPAGRDQPAAPARTAHRRARPRRRGRGAMKGARPSRAQRHDSALKHVTGAGALYRRHARAAGHAACRAGAEPGRAAAACASSTCRRRARCPAWSPCSAPATFPARTTSPPPARTSRCSPTDTVEFAGQPLAMVVADVRSTRRAHAAERADDRHRAAPSRSSTSRRRWRGKAYVQAPSTILRGDPDAALAARAAQAERRVQRRRPGAFLSRRPDRLRPARRGRRHRRPFLDPASDRGPAHLRPPAGLRLQSRDDGGAPPGRRLRRQGEQRLVGRRARRRSARTRPAGR